MALVNGALRESGKLMDEVPHRLIRWHEVLGVSARGHPKVIEGQGIVFTNGDEPGVPAREAIRDPPTLAPIYARLALVIAFAFLAAFVLFA